MAVLPSHIRPTNRQDWLDTHKARRRIAVPTRSAQLQELVVEVWIDATHVNGLAVDAVVTGRAVKRAPAKPDSQCQNDTSPFA